MMICTLLDALRASSSQSQSPPARCDQASLASRAAASVSTMVALSDCCVLRLPFVIVSEMLPTHSDKITSLFQLSIERLWKGTLYTMVNTLGLSSQVYQQPHQLSGTAPPAPGEDSHSLDPNYVVPLRAHQQGLEILARNIGISVDSPTLCRIEEYASVLHRAPGQVILSPEDCAVVVVVQGDSQCLLM